MKSRKKLPFWFPYTERIQLKGKKVQFHYKGGESEALFNGIHSIMFYGGHCPLTEDFLEKCRQNKIPICIHKRNIPQATWILPSPTVNNNDLIGRQILTRNSKKKCQHIARKLLKAKFLSMRWLVEETPEFSRTSSIKEMRIKEAVHAKQYWTEYFYQLGEQGCHRRGKLNPIKSALDAVSKFCVTIILRWLLYHKLSPYHGFLHISTGYPSLVYDLIEPFRGYIDKWVFEVIQELKSSNPELNDFIGCSIAKVKKKLYDQVFVQPTRQIVTFHELFHGSVLALRAYLLGDAKRFIPPTPKKPNGGRPIQAGYHLYGRSAGPTDFWQIAHKISKSLP